MTKKQEAVKKTAPFSTTRLKLLHVYLRRFVSSTPIKLGLGPSEDKSDLIRLRVRWDNQL